MIFIGYYTDIKILAVLGFATIFLLGLTLNLSGLTYKSGSTESYSYMCMSCNGNSMPDLIGNNTVLTSVTTVDDYTALTDQASLWIGRWLMIVAVLGAILVFTSNKKSEDDD